MVSEETLRKVKKCCRKLDKMLNEKDYSNANEILNKLKECAIEPKVLLETKVGFKVNTLRRKCKAKKLMILESHAKNLIKSWQRVISLAEERKRKDSSEESDSDSDDSDVPIQRKPSSHSRPNEDRAGPSRSNTEKRSYSTKKENSHPNKFKVRSVDSSDESQSNYAPREDDARKKGVKLIYEALKTEPTFASSIKKSEIKEKAKQIERHIYDEFNHIGPKYTQRVRSRVSNLKDPKNPDLRTNVLKGTLSPRKLAIMSPEEMANDEMKALREKLNMEALVDYQIVEEHDGFVQCPLCKAASADTAQAQPSSSMHNCGTCGHMWKDD